MQKMGYEDTMVIASIVAERVFPYAGWTGERTPNVILKPQFVTVRSGKPTLKGGEGGTA